MASACINSIGLSPDNFLDCSPTTYSSYAWLTPRTSIACEMADDASKNNSRIPSPEMLSDLPEEPDLDLFDIADFEFRLEDPVMMLPADQLFSEGKLIPLHLPQIHPEPDPDATSSTTTPSDKPKPRRRMNSVSVVDPFLLSPKTTAPRCSSRWKELLGLRKVYQKNNIEDINRASSPPSSRNGSGNKSIKHFLHRSSKSSNDSSVTLPLLKDTDNDPTSVSSPLSLSSSSSGHDPDDLPRISLDSENPKPGKVNLNTNRIRMVKTRTLSSDVGRSQSPIMPDSTHARGVSIDSPRMNSSGKIVFHSLERSSSSPSSFNGGPRFKQNIHRDRGRGMGMERSYSANVRVTPVLNVPVCSLRKSGGVFGLPLFSSSNQKRGDGTNNGRSN